MKESTPLYNSRIAKVYIDFVQKNYPDIDVEAMLEQTGINVWELEDPSHWFTQDQQDRLHDALVLHTGNENIAQDAGRYAGSSDALGAIRQYIIGLMNPAAIYMLLGKIYPMLSRAAEVHPKKTGPNSMEIFTVPKANFEERPYQCDNRMGLFEAIAKLYSDKYADVDHPSCVHKGDDFCRYIIKWDKSPKICGYGFGILSFLQILCFWRHCGLSFHFTTG